MGTTARRASTRRLVVGLAMVALLTAMGGPSAAGEPEGAGNQPDALVSKADASFSGDGVYNTSAVGQTLTRTKPRGSTASFYLRIQNDGPEDTWVNFRGCAGNNSFRVRYFGVDDNLQNPSDLTDLVVQGWTGPVAGGDEGSPFLVRITVNRTAPAGATLNCKFKVHTTSDGITYLRDAVKMVVHRA